MTPQQVVDDFRRRYEGTFIFVQEPNSMEENLFQVERIEPNDEKLGIIDLISDALGRITLNFGTAHTLKFKTPVTGAFQYGADAFIYMRFPRRQYRRGICSDNSLIKRATYKCLAAPNTFNWATVNAAFIGKTYSPQEAIKLLAAGKHRSVAMDNGYSLSLSFTNNSNDHVLFYMATPIARIAQDGKVTYVGEAAYESQINALFPKVESQVNTMEVVYG